MPRDVTLAFLCGPAPHARVELSDRYVSLKILSHALSPGIEAELHNTDGLTVLLVPVVN